MSRKISKIINNHFPISQNKLSSHYGFCEALIFNYYFLKIQNSFNVNFIPPFYAYKIIS